MTDTSTRQGMNPAVKVILIVVAILLGLVLIAVGLVAWLISAGVDMAQDAILRAETEATLEQVNVLVVRHHESTGALPASLDELSAADPFEDGWGFPILYAPDAATGTYEIRSFGRDGLEGGEGADLDIVHRSRVEPR